MGLLAALNTAVSGLNVNQQNLNTLSQNISNANTPNYSNEVVNQQANFINGQGAGTNIAGITREVNQFLTSEVQTQTSANGAATQLTSYYSQIQNYLGQPGGSGDIDSQISSFFVALQDLANSPSASAETNAVNSASSMASSISNLSNSLQGLRLQSDSDISSAISTVNSDLSTLFNTNAAIEQASARGENTAGLLDTRDATLTDLAQYVDISPIYSNSGEVTVSTNGGATLLTANTYSQLSFTPSTSIQTFTSNNSMSPITSTLYDGNGRAEGTTIIATGGQPSNVTTTLTSGKIASLLSMRDTIIPNILGQLDQLANTVTTQVNAISNEGSSFPPQNSYTGTTLTSGNSTSTYSGNMLIAAVSATGSPLTSPYADEPNGMQALNLDLSNLNYGNGKGVLSTDDIIDSINQFYGAPQNKAELGNLNNVQLQVASNNVPQTNSAGSSNTLSFNFNLNNISGSSAAFYSGGYTVLDSSGNVVASTTNSTVTSTQPSVNINNIATDGAGNVTYTGPAGSTYTIGQTVYINPPSGVVNGVAGSAYGGFYTVTATSGNTFTVANTATSSAGIQNTAVTGVSANTLYDTAATGGNTSTSDSGIVTATLGSPPLSATQSPYYTVQANVATVDSNGNLVTSVVSYQIPNQSSNTMNNLIGATSATGSGKIVAPTTKQPIITAELVDANGNPLPKVNGSYGSEQGYIKLLTNNSSNAVAFNQLNSQQSTYTGTFGITGTGQGLAQYFGLNNFFAANPPPVVGGNITSTITNSASNMAVNSALTTNPGLITTGKLTLGTQPTASSGAAPNYSYLLTSGDNSISQALAGIATATQTFAASGGLPSASTTLTGYAGNIIAATSTNATNATNNQTNAAALLSGFTKSAQSTSGVNLDQELANTVIYQNAYSASARIISVVDALFSTLIGAIPAQ